MRPRVVISGLGAISAAGVGVEPLWESLRRGVSSIGEIGSFDASGFRSAFGGHLDDYSAKNVVPKSYRKAVKVMARDSELAVGAAQAAVADAGLITRAGEGDPSMPGARLGCHIGAGLLAADTEELAGAFSTATDEQGQLSLKAWGERGMGNLQPLWMLNYLPNMLACHVTIIHGAEGPSNTLTCGEASGLLSIAESTRVIERGAADACLSGGVESKINPMGLARQNLFGRTADTGGLTADDAWRAVRPYDPEATGTLMGEGGGIVVVESLESAQRRGVTPACEVLGQGSSQSPCGVIGTGQRVGSAGGPCEGCNLGLVDAIEAALADAGIGPGEIDAIVPAAVGHPALDHAELCALQQVFAQRLEQIPMVTLAPFIGDLAAGAGAIQAIAGAMCIREQALPARLHAGRPNPQALAGAAESANAELNRVLVCCGSLAGQNAALVLGRVA